MQEGTPDTLDTILSAKTPGGILLELRPAGLTARCYAYLLDLLIKLAVLYVFEIAAVFAGGIGIALNLILIFTLEWLYPVVFELSRRGATPGKRRLGLRVIMDNGLPVTPAASLTRNLLRAADFLPFLYGFAVVSMLVRRDAKRLGDLAAGTLVVYQPQPVAGIPGTDIAPLAPAIRSRSRGNFEAADLGVRLCQSAARSVFPCYLTVLVPVTALALASFSIAAWLPIIVLWWAKPWLDRTILFTLSRAACGQSTRPADLWREQRQVWWDQLFLTLTWRRLSPWRSFTQPVYQLEGLRGAELQARVRQVRSGRGRAGTGISSAFGCAETSVLFALVALMSWLAPKGTGQNLIAQLALGVSSGWVDFVLSVAYAVTIGLVEPFYVAAGFALYLNRRAELQAAAQGTGLV